PRDPRPVPPVYSAERAARAILLAARRPAREYWLGNRTVLVAAANALLPGLLDRFLARTAIQGQERDTMVARGRQDNLFEPVAGLHQQDGAFGNEASDHAMLIPGPVVGLTNVAIGIGVG